MPLTDTAAPKRSLGPRLEEVIERIEAARAEGLPVTADIYPYHASSTGLTYILPAWVKEGPHSDMIARLQDPAMRARLLDEIDMITGATLTSTGVTHTIQFWLGDSGYGPYLEAFRKGVK